MQKITPFLWFDDKAEEAVNFYMSLFPKSKITTLSRYGEEGAKVSGRPKGSVMAIDFTLNGQQFSAVNGGPMFTFSPAISFFVQCKTEKEVDELFNNLSKGGEVMMPLAKYPFSEKYAFLKDKYGLSWQLMLSPNKSSSIVPSLLFVGKDLGKAEPAVKFYTKIFKNSNIDSMSYYGSGEPGKQGTVKHCSFKLHGQEFMAMDGTGPHKFTFTEGLSFLVNCATQQEVDKLWEILSESGNKGQCGWLKDKFGVSWQIIPSIMGKLMSSKDPEKSARVMKAMLGMTKIDIKALKRAHDQK